MTNRRRHLGVVAMAALALLAAPSCGVPSDDRTVLAAFYEAADGANWTVNTNWNTDAPLDQWYGVSTDATDRVTSLELDGNQLSGSIPDALAALTNLRVLRLGGNQLSSSIPDALAALTNLEELSLGGSQLSGSIPDALAALTNLRVLSLANNQLSGSIPDALAGLTNLEELSLGGNQLSGSIPAALCRFADAVNPQQGGVILPCAASSGDSGNDLATLVENLNELALAYNRAVLVEFYEATNGANWAINRNWNSDAPLDLWYGVSTDTTGHVTALYLDRNRLSGSIPASLGRLTNLRGLYLDRNQLSGPIPAALSGLTNLRMLYLDDNQLSGSIPVALCSFAINPQQSGSILPCAVSSGDSDDDRTVLVEFYEATGGGNWAVNRNWGSDVPLDRWYGVGTDTAGRVTSLHLDGNQLSGPIPASLGRLTNLRMLSLDGNQLSSSIPASLGDLTNLRGLYLDDNQLSGSIPASLDRLTNLVQLSLSVTDYRVGLTVRGLPDVLDLRPARRQL